MSQSQNKSARIGLRLIPVVILLAFVVLMNAGNWLKKPWGKDDNVPLHIHSLTNHLQNGDWMRSTDELQEHWEDLGS